MIAAFRNLTGMLSVLLTYGADIDIRNKVTTAE